MEGNNEFAFNGGGHKLYSYTSHSSNRITHYKSSTLSNRLNANLIQKIIFHTPFNTKVLAIWLLVFWFAVACYGDNTNTSEIMGKKIAECVNEHLEKKYNYARSMGALYIGHCIVKYEEEFNHSEYSSIIKVMYKNIIIK